jgi:prepilin-type processing-associated H-X9-DG protein
MRRRGLTWLELLIVITILVVLLAVSLPTLVRMRERARRLGCASNLGQIGKMIEAYRTADPAAAFPGGTTFARGSQAGTSWWLDLMPFSDMKDMAEKWRASPVGGDFGGAVANPNIVSADGYVQSIFFCASSPLPTLNDPAKHLSEPNRKQLGSGTPKGIAVPMYAAVAGSAPDVRDVVLTKFASSPYGRNTAQYQYGILSDSGAMPVNRRVPDAAVRDPKGKTLLVVEQSDYFRDTQNGTLDPPDLYDLRSAWPKGVFMGASADYGELSPLAIGLNGNGQARCWNVTTIRYPIHEKTLLGKSGIVVDPAPPRPPKEGEPAPAVPPYPPTGYGPGHNHGINSAHPGGAHVLMADGAVFFLKDEIDVTILLQMATRDDGGEFNDIPQE